MMLLRRVGGIMKISKGLLLSVSILIYIYVGCTDNGFDNTKGHTIQTYYGIYVATDDSTNIAMRKTDACELTVIDNYKYTFQFSNINADPKELCDHNGTVFGFGSNKVAFYPDEIIYQNCDSFRIPRDTFNADFINNADTIIINQINGLAVRRLKLLK